LQQEYNELNQAQFKTHNDLKALQINHDRLIRVYGKMEVINVQQEQIFAKLENTYLQHQEQLIKVNIDMENRTHELWVHLQKLMGELETLR
jgi:hypothetical protein